MRRILLLSAALFLLVGACWDPNSFATGAAGGTGGVASVCDGTNDCDTCTSCATNGPCAQLNSACLADAARRAINQCATPPCDAACMQNCMNDNPDGVAAWDAVTSCID